MARELSFSPADADSSSSSAEPSSAQAVSCRRRFLVFCLDLIDLLELTRLRHSRQKLSTKRAFKVSVPYLPLSIVHFYEVAPLPVGPAVEGGCHGR